MECETKPVAGGMDNGKFHRASAGVERDAFPPEERGAGLNRKQPRQPPVSRSGGQFLL